MKIGFKLICEKYELIEHLNNFTYAHMFIFTHKSVNFIFSNLLKTQIKSRLIIFYFNSKIALYRVAQPHVVNFRGK